MKKKISLRILSAFLALMMVVATGVTVVTALEIPYDKDQFESDGREVVTTTDAEIVAKYSFLSTKEKNILNCKAIAGDTHTIPVPSDNDNLIAIDAENQTVTADTFTSGNYVWTPVKAYLVYTDAANNEVKIPVALDENGYGEFDTREESYSVEVDYEVRVAIDLDEQRLLVNTPSLLANGLINLNLVSACEGDLGTIASEAVFSALMQMIEPVDTVYGTMYLIDPTAAENAAIVNALLAMKAEREANNGQFALYNEIITYKASSNKVAYLVNNGVAFKNAHASILKNLSDFTVGFDKCKVAIDMFHQMHLIDETTYNNLVLVQGILHNLIANLEKAQAANWEYAEHTLVKADATALELEALDLALKAALNDNGTASFVNRHDTEELTESLVAATTTVKAGVAQSMVNVTVNAQVISASSVNSNTLTTIAGKTVSFLMKDGSTQDEINAKIASVGICADTLAYWTQNASEYNIASEFYAPNTTFTFNPETGVTDVTITYVPVTFTITTSYAEVNTVFYGYRFQLPNHTDASKSYDYKVNGVAKYQGEIIKVTENLNVTRTEGTALESSTINAMIADSSVGATLTAEARAILKANAFKASQYPNLFDALRYRTPTVANLETTGENGYKVTASSAASGLLSGAVWTAVSVDLLDANGAILANYPMTNGVCEFAYTGTFENARVNFTLAVTDIATGDAVTIANIPHTLATEAADQIVILNRMADGSLYSSLGSLDNTTINLIVTVVNSSEMSDETKTVVSTLKTDCVDASGNIILYKQLTDYKSAKAKGAAEGLKYYYTGNNASNIKHQLDVLSEVFNALCPDDANDPDRIIFTDLLASNGLGEYIEKLDSIKEAIDDCKDIAPVNAYVDTNSASLGILTSAIFNAIGKTGAYAGNGVVEYTDSVTLAAPDKTTVNLSVIVMNGDGTTTTLKDTVTLTKGDVVGNIIKNKMDALDAQLTIDKNYYSVAGKNNIPTGNIVIDDVPSNIIITYTPYTYTVSVPGAADQSFFYDQDWTITLPAPSSNSIKYVYTVAGEAIEVLDQAVRYTFESLDVFGTDRTYTVTVESVDLESEKLFNFVDLMNTAFADMGAKLIPVQDEKGNIVMVFRASSSVASVFNGDMMTDLAFALSMYENVQLGGSLFWDGASVHLQAMTDMVASGGFSFDVFCDVIDENGNVINDATLSQLTPMIDPEGNIGGKLMTSTINIDGRTMSFYVTLADTVPASMLGKMRSAIVTVKDYVNIVCADGKFQFVITAPDAIYPYYLAQMLVAGNIDITDISALNLRDSIQYEWSLISGILEDDRFSIETLENTFAELGRDVDLSRFEGIFNNFKKVHYYLKDNTEIVSYDVSSDAYAGTFKIDLRGVLQRVMTKFGLNDTMMSFVYEAREDAEPFEIDYEVKLTNIIDKDYDAIVFDIKGNGLTKKFYCTNNLTDILNNVGNYAIIILTSDVELTGDVYIPQNAVIDLNGFTITGNIATGGTVRIVDSRFDTQKAGIVEGKLTGNFIITGGKYTSDISKYLTNGYYVDEKGYVRNEIYSLRKNGNDVQIAISADYLNNFALLDFQSMLVDIAVDIAMSAYTGAAISIDGNYIYSFSCEDITKILGGGTNTVINSIIDILDVQGLSKVVNSVVAELTDFNGLANAINRNEALVDYELSVENWNIVPYIADGNYITFDAVPSNKESGRFTVVIEGSNEAKAELVELCRNLNVVEVNKAEINVNDIHYGEGGIKGFNVDFNGTLDVHINLAENRAYAAILVAAAAYSADNSFDRAGYKGALETYLADKGTDAVVEAIERMTVAELIAACKALDGITCEQMLTAVGVELGEQTEGILSIYRSYDEFINICSKVLKRLDVTGNGANLAGNKVAGTYATYVFDTELVNRINVTIKITTVATTGTVIIGKPSLDLSGIGSIGPGGSTFPAVGGAEYIKGYESIKLPSGLNAMLIDAGINGLTVEGFLSVFNVETDGAISYKLKVRNHAGVEVTGDTLIGTGFTFTIMAYNGINYQSETHTLVIAGDTNGNGRIEVGDALGITSVFKGDTQWSEIEEKAGDLNRDGEIDILDAAALVIKYKDFENYESAYAPNN